MLRQAQHERLKDRSWCPYNYGQISKYDFAEEKGHKKRSVMREVLFNKIQRLKEETKYLVDNKPKLLRKLKSSTETKKIVERSVYLCAEIVLDVADLIIIKKGYPKPSTYSDSIYKLGEYGLIPKEFAQKFVYIAGLRNFLAHDYQKNTVPELEKFLKYGLNDIKKFIKAVEALF